MLVALTPNLALDRTLLLEQPLASGRLHRVAQVREAAGGKGMHVARVVRALGSEARVAGFLAGWNGRKFRALLAEEGFDGVFVEVSGETRECQIILGGSHPTELNERGPSVGLQAWHELLARLPHAQLVIAGSLAPGLRPRDFAAILASLPEKPVVDTSGEWLQVALEARVALVKPNLRELAQVTGRSNAGIEEARALFERCGTPVLLTLGEEGAAYLGEERWLAEAPAVAAINPVGSGDSLLGAFLWARGEGRTLEEALRLGVAAGADNARRGGGGRVTRSGVAELFAQVESQPLR